MMLLYDEGETFVEGVIDAYSNSAKNINNNVWFQRYGSDDKTSDLSNPKMKGR